MVLASGFTLMKTAHAIIIGFPVLKMFRKGQLNFFLLHDLTNNLPVRG
ncbi:hypothetical protein [Desulfopila sp. IMCC35008]